MQPRKALIISLFERYSAMAMSFVSIVILSRLLTPTDIGIFTVAFGFVNLANTIRDFGVTNYLIKEKDLTLDIVATALGITFLIAWSLAGILYLCSGLISSLYDEVGIEAALVVMTFVFVIDPFGALAPALLKRSMRFDLLYKINTGSAFVYTVTVIALAYAGLGFMAMAWAAVAGSITRVLISIWYLPSEYRTWPRLTKWRELVWFGGYAMGIQLLAQASRSGSELLIGKILGFATLGFFSRAQGYVRMFNESVLNAIHPVARATLAQKNRNGEDLSAPYMKALGYITVISWPALFFLSIMALPVIRVLFGDQWDSAAPLATILCLEAMIMTIVLLNNDLIVALGEMKRQFRVASIVHPLRIVFVVVGCSIDIYWVVLALTFAALIHAGLSLKLVMTLIDIDTKSFRNSLLCNAFVTLCMALGPLLSYAMIGPDPNQHLFLLLFSSALALAGWYVGILLIKHPIKSEILALFKDVANRLDRKRSK